MFKTELFCAALWQGPKILSLPRLSRGDVLYLEFTESTRSHIEGLFVVEQRLDMHISSKGGYCQRLQIRPQDKG